MVSPDLDLDVSPIPRSREENQERAFIAASRRKDRSLDARLESANRASQLHKKRTGKGLFITREIVEREAMYEEVDERYQEKRIRMLQAQNMQIEEQLNRQLLAALAIRSNGLQQRRASSMTPRGPVDGVRKMSLDLSNIRASISEGMPAETLSSPMMMDPSYVMSPSYDQNSHSPYLVPESSYSDVVPGSSSSHFPSYVTQAPTWNTTQAFGPHPVRSPWAGFHPQQHQLPQHSQISNAPMRPFRDRLASAPDIPVQHGMPLASTPLPMSSNTTTTGPMSQHTRVRSDPGHTFLAYKRVPSSGSNSPKVEMVSTESLSTPDLCPTPSTAHSPRSTGHDGGILDLESLGKEGEMVFSTHEELDPDFDEFSRFAWGLGNTNQVQDRDPLGFDDFVALDEFAATA